MTSTPSPNIRLTITVSPEVHATFQRIAKASNMSISKAMGEWLGDTIEAAEFMALKVEQARAAPKIVIAEMHAYALGMADETGKIMEQMRTKGAQVRKAGGGAAGEAALAGAPVVPSPASSPIPPSGNTGGKGIRNPGSPKQRGGK